MRVSGSLVQKGEHVGSLTSSARYMFFVNTPASPPCSVSPRKYFCSGPSPSGPLVRAMYRYAENAPGRTEMYPNAL